jgi:hypothetical protein
MQTESFEPGGYRYIRGPFQYCGGVAAEPGFTIERIRFARPVPLEAGFRRIEAHLAALGRPTTAFCACELRSAAPFDDEGFRAFNRLYVGTLERWGLFRDEENPVARTNVCPAFHAPETPSFEAFSYTVPAPTEAPPAFVLSGGGDARPGPAPYAERIVRHGETSPDAMREKGRFVLDLMEARLGALGLGWEHATAVQAYAVEDLQAVMAEEIAPRGAARPGLVWHYARPPVKGLAFEMDVRGVPVERTLPAKT